MTRLRALLSEKNVACTLIDDQPPPHGELPPRDDCPEDGNHDRDGGGVADDHARENTVWPRVPMETSMIPRQIEMGPFFGLNFGWTLSGGNGPNHTVYSHLRAK
jgi:hypothetical protein